MEIIDKLGLDLKLLIAQIVNFTIVLVILTKFIYKPLLATLDKRKKMIEKNVEDTRRIEEKLLAIEQDRSKTIKEAGAEAMKIIEKTKKEAEEEKEKTLQSAKKEISTLAERYREQLHEEKSAMLNEIKKEITALIIKSTEKLLKREFSKGDQSKLQEALEEEIKSVKY